MTTIHIHFVEFDETNTDEQAPDPLDVFIQKIEALADLLGCTEEQAERIILQRL